MQLLFLHIAIEAVVVRVLLRSHRDPAARIAWIVAILALPRFSIQGRMECRFTRQYADSILRYGIRVGSRL